MKVNSGTFKLSELRLAVASHFMCKHCRRQIVVLPQCSATAETMCCDDYMLPVDGPINRRLMEGEA